MQRISIKPNFFFRWLPKAAMRHAEADPSDCVLVVGVSRPKMALAILTIMLLSLCLTFHLIYDSALSSLQRGSAAKDALERQRPPVLLLSRRMYPVAARRLPQVEEVCCLQPLSFWIIYLAMKFVRASSSYLLRLVGTSSHSPPLSFRDHHQIIRVLVCDCQILDFGRLLNKYCLLMQLSTSLLPPLLP